MHILGLLYAMWPHLDHGLGTRLDSLLDGQLPLQTGHVLHLRALPMGRRGAREVTEVHLWENIQNKQTKLKFHQSIHTVSVN